MSRQHKPWAKEGSVSSKSEKFAGKSGKRGAVAQGEPVKVHQSANAGGVWIYGLHAVAEAWCNPDRACLRLLATPAAMEELAGTFEKARKKGINRPNPEHTDKISVDKILPQGAVHQGVGLLVKPLAEEDISVLISSENPPSVLLILDQVTDPHNIGAILRSAAAFGAGGVVLTERHAPSATGVMAKTASGALEHVPLLRVVNLARTLEELSECGYWCIGLSEHGTRTLAEVDLSGKVALVLGAEGTGLRRLTAQRCDELARLPTSGPIQALNVSNAAAVALYEIKRGRG
jgi:23S rRNA (guanosine2251-2'-O)-methyltransferase